MTSQYGACAWHTEAASASTHAHSHSGLHGNSGYAKAPQLYFTLTLHRLLTFMPDFCIYVSLPQEFCILCAAYVYGLRMFTFSHCYLFFLQFSYFTCYIHLFAGS